MNSWPKPTAEQVQRAIALTSVPSQRWEFFRRLNNPMWIEPLRDVGFFQSPPGVISNDDGTIQFATWPEASYLARVAADRPEAVADTILAFPTTDNPRIALDVAGAAVVMPPEQAVRLLPVLERVIDAGYWIDLLADRVASLVGALAEAGKGDEALSLARRMLFPTGVETVGTPGPFSRQQPTFRLSDWQYEQFIQHICSPLVESIELRAMAFFGELLAEVLAADRAHSAEERQAGDVLDDLSYIWRPAIEDHAQNPGSERADPIVTALRVVGEQLLRKPTPIEVLLAGLQDHKALIFRRLRLHVLALAVGRDDADAVRVAAQMLLDDEWFGDDRLRHEYFRLAKTTFPRLAPEVKGRLMDRILDGPDASDWRTRFTEARGEEASPQEEQDYADWWRLVRLAPIADYLEPPAVKIFTDLTTRLGAPEHPDFVSYMTSRLGWRSPVEDADLARRAPEEVLDYLRSWAPRDDFDGPTVEGLAQSFQAAVRERPREFAPIAREFADLRPEYVSALLQALRDQMGELEGRIEPIMQLCLDVLDRTGEGDDERGVRLAVAWFLTTALKVDGLRVANDLLWALVERLASDADPNREFEDRYGGSNMDPLTLSLNVVRSLGVEGAFLYARRRHLDDETTLDQLPAVKTLLDTHLDPDIESSEAVRAMYGRYLGLMLAIAPDWVAERFDELFPQDDNLWGVTWSAFVAMSNPSKQALRVLRKQYERSVRSEPSERLRGPGHPKGPKFNLVQHVLSYYWWGEIPLDDELIRAVFAEPETATWAIEFIGRSLGQGESPPEEVMERLRELWAWRLADAFEDDTARPSHIEELAAFGWWFASGRGDPGWLLHQLNVVVDAGVAVDWAHAVVEQLAETVKIAPRESVRALALLVELSTTTPWGLHAIQRESVAVIEAAFAHAGDPELEEATRRLVDRFINLGFPEMRDLRPRQASSFRPAEGHASN